MNVVQAQDVPTINFGYITAATPEIDVGRVVLHEVRMFLELLVVIHSQTSDCARSNGVD